MMKCRSRRNAEFMQNQYMTTLLKYSFAFRLVIQPNIEKGITFGHVVIDVVKDANAKDWPPIVLDINNITINKAQGEFYFDST